jgi:hypothetical protein
MEKHGDRKSDIDDETELVRRLQVGDEKRSKQFSSFIHHSFTTPLIESSAESPIVKKSFRMCSGVLIARHIRFAATRNSPPGCTGWR